MNQTECPYCKAVNQIGQAGAGHTLQCAACRRTFMATSVVPAAPVVRSPAAGASSIPAVPMHRPAQPRPAQPLPAQPQRGAGGRSAHPPGARQQVPGAIPAGAIPVASASPTAAVTPVVTDRSPPQRSSAGATRGGSRNTALMWWAGGVMCFVVGALLLIVAFLASGRSRPAPRGGGSGSPEIVHLTPGNSRRSGWADAAGNTVVRINSVSVDVDYVEYGEVRAKDTSRRVIVSDSKDYLQIYLTISNQAPRPIRYASWYGNTFDSDGRMVAATLVDDRGRSYEMREFRSVAGVRGHTDRADLAPRESVSDVVIFAIPPTLERRDIRYFHLELPAEAYGGSGMYRFEIPRRAAQGF